MIKKRAILYFAVIGFPMGIGAGATSWLELPELPKRLGVFDSPRTNLDEAQAAPAEVEREDSRVGEIGGVDAYSPSLELADFGRVHPILVGTFTILMAAGLVIVTDKSHRK